MRKIAKLGVLVGVAAVTLAAWAASAFATTGYPPSVGPATDPSVSAQTASNPSTAGLAFTGSSHTALFVAVGAALVIVGVFLVVVARRRRVLA